MIIYRGLETRSSRVHGPLYIASAATHRRCSGRWYVSHLHALIDKAEKKGRERERKIEQRRYRMLSSSWSLVASYRRGEEPNEREREGDEFCNQLSNFFSLFSLSRSLVLQPRSKKAINRYPSPRSFVRTRVTYTRCGGPRGADVCARSCGRTSFGRYRAIAEWVMHPAKAWGHQMNYDISFSHPYIPLRPLVSPTRLIAFNSLLVHSNTIASFRAFLPFVRIR